MKIRTSIFISALLSLSGVSAVAQTWNPAPSENLSITSYPEGLSSIELTGELTINRQCNAFATLEKNGIVVKQIPASNKVAVYTFDGPTKLTNDAAGSLHVSFTGDVKNSPYKTTGRYKVTIPGGYFYHADGTPNAEMSAEWYIDNVSMEVSPNSGSNVNELNTITIEFPEAQRVEVASNVTINYVPADPDADENLYETMSAMPEVNGTTVTITMPETLALYTAAGSGTVTVSYKSGTFKVYYDDINEPSSNSAMTSKYTINSLSNDANGGYYIEPYSREVYDLQSFMVCDNFTCDTSLARQCYFILYPPEGKEIVMVGKANGYIYEVIDGVRQKTAIKYFTGQKYNVIKNGAIMFYLAGQPSTPGTITLAPGHYQFVIGKNADYTNRNPELAFDFKVKANPNSAPVNTVVYPPTDENVDILDHISVEFPAAKVVELKKGSYATITTGNIEYTAAVALNEDGINPVIEIAPYAPLVIKGKYEVEVPTSDISVDGIPYNIKLNYDITGAGNLTGIDSAEISSDLDIYSIQGHIIARKCRIEFLKSLPSGLYIVNGQKVLVR